MSSRRRQSRAFTLLELLVATAMTAVLAGSLYATLHIAFRARRAAAAAVEQMRKAELALELVRADLESAVVPKDILAGAFFGEDMADGAGRASDILTLHCTADGAQETEGTGDIRMVQFACEPAEDDEWVRRDPTRRGPQGMVLLRRLTLNLLTTKVQEPTEEVLCRDVRSFDLRYFDGTDWQDAWDSAAQDNALPLAVEVTLELVGEDARDTDQGGYCVSRVFRLPCSSITAGRQVETAP